MKRNESKARKKTSLPVPKLALVTPVDMISTLERYEGHVETVADYYGVTSRAIYKYFARHPEVWPELHEIRSNQSEVDLDTAEKVLRFCMESLTDNPKLAQDTAKYILDSKGSSRGYGDRGQKDNQGKSKALLEDISKWSKTEYDEIKLLIDD